MASWNFFLQWWQHLQFSLQDGHLTNQTIHGFVQKKTHVYGYVILKLVLYLICGFSLQNPTLEHYTSYKSSNIRMCVCALQELQHNTNNCPLKSIREKYGQPKVQNHEFAVAPHPKWIRVATCKWNHKYPSCHCLLVLQPCNKLCSIAVWVCRQPEITRAAAVTLHMTSSLLIQPFAATILRPHHQTYSSSVSLHCLKAVMFPNFFLVLH
jgi:hypothetical protein